jgi:hypothetical protein
MLRGSSQIRVALGIDTANDLFLFLLFGSA